MHLYAFKNLIKRFEIFLCNCSLAKPYRIHICHFSIKHLCAIICKKRISFLQWKCANKVIRIELELGQNNYPVSWNIQSTSLLTSERPTWCHLIFYFTSYLLNMFRTLIYPSSGACDWSFSLQNEHHSKPAAPKIQHTTNWEQDDQCGNSTTQSEAPDDGYINVRNMLST